PVGARLPRRRRRLDGGGGDDLRHGATASGSVASALTPTRRAGGPPCFRYRVALGAAPRTMVGRKTTRTEASSVLLVLQSLVRGVQSGALSGHRPRRTRPVGRTDRGPCRPPARRRA